MIEIHDFNEGDKALSAMIILPRIIGVLKESFIHPPFAQQLPGNLLQLLNELPKASNQCEFLLCVWTFFNA
ncbi:hypothetical protein EUGRSUZ_H02827 [Eucalyptus grandis]|uniref:Uncharacterized protein n=2 Tax=Eucalyptus grandis TaxID=71139 RepID=A0ACC3JT51_EUCGR|nr:hypothetical protein EUGRSUZ_H02827 [Eucalyptus grandis]